MVIVRILANFLIIVQLLSMTISLVTFGSVFLFFPSSIRWNIDPLWNMAFPFAVAAFCQVPIGLIVYDDAHKRNWDSEIKRDMWASLGKSEYSIYNHSLPVSPLLSSMYVFIIMNRDGAGNWWQEKENKSALFRFVSSRAAMDFFLKTTRVAAVLFLVGGLLFALSFGVRAEWFFLVSLKVLGSTIIFLPPCTLLFYYLTFAHFLSREWPDHGFEMFYEEVPVGKWPKHDWLDYERYYRKVMRDELT